MQRKALADKILVLGIDGLDPRLTSKYVAEGKMPNTEKFIARGAQRKDLVMLGGQPTVTPPMWTTLATGAYPVTHGITCFGRQNPEHLDQKDYNLDSTLCLAEQVWNCFAEAGKKTLVWHWPGSSWPPTSDSPNLMVVDGTSPGAPNMAVATMDAEFILSANEKTEEVYYRRKAVSDENFPCVINDLKAVSDEVQSQTAEYHMKHLTDRVGGDSMSIILLTLQDGEGGTSDEPFDVVLSPIKPAEKWADAPAEAKEFTMLYSAGLIHRPCLILKNEQGIYDRVAIFKNKKATEPIAVLEKDVFTEAVIDEAMRDDKRYVVNRNMRIFDMAEDGSSLRIWVSAGMDTTNDSVWHPKRLFKEVTENIGFPPPTPLLGGANKTLISKCMHANWDAAAKWQGDSLNYLIEHENLDVIFSHFHSVDLQGHCIVKYMKDHGEGRKMTETDYAQCMEDVYTQADDYIGYFLPLLDKGWTILIVSDHAQICPEYGPVLLGDMIGVNVGVMRELGFTQVKKDENGNDLKEIDWEHTKAVANLGNHIYINLKGRYETGIVEPEDQYKLEEEIMTALYGYRDKRTGHRVVALALRNRDAVLLGMGGPYSGDILYWMAEGYNYDHCDSLSTTLGYGEMSVSPIFIAAGKGLKEGYRTERIIREVDVAPTVAVLGGVRMPKHCEGAPVYQILAEEF